jgi:ketosteroid isomerase-like protein
MARILPLMQLALLLVFAAAMAEDVPAAITRLEHEWAAAFLAHDVKTIDRILADDFVGVDGRAMVSDKKSELEEAKSTEPGDFVLLDDQISDISVRVYGTTAVANAISNEKARFKGKDIAPRYRRTTVWVKRDGRWQCVSFHASRIAEKPPG